jgi:hypothetical protein
VVPTRTIKIKGVPAEQLALTAILHLHISRRNRIHTQLVRVLHQVHTGCDAGARNLLIRTKGAEAGTVNTYDCSITCRDTTSARKVKGKY